MDYPTTPEDVLRLTIAEKFELLSFSPGLRGEVREFTAIALTDGVPLSRYQQKQYAESGGAAIDEARISRYIIKAMIVGNANDEVLAPVDNPHRFLPDPCNLGDTVDVSTTLRVIKFYTTYITSKDFNITSESVVRRGDKVRVTMVVDKDGNIKTGQGQLIDIISKAAKDPFLQNICDSLQGKFDVSNLALLSNMGDHSSPGGAPSEEFDKRLRFTFEQYCEMRPTFQPLLDFIARHEGSYNSVNRGCSGDSPGGAAKWMTSNKRNLTSMSVRDVIAHQRDGSKASNVPGNSKCSSSRGADGFLAVGKFQFIPDTLDSAASRIKDFNKSTTFNEETQECMGVYLLLGKRKSLGGYLMGLYDDVTVAAQDMALEWASQPLQYDYKKCKRGQSAYCGSGNNMSKISPGEAIAQLQAARSAADASSAVASVLRATGYTTA